MNKIGRNRSCPCGSGRKFKRCCATTSRHAMPASAEETQLLRQASGLHRSGHLSAAEQRCAQLLRLNPSHVEARHLSAIIAGQRGEFAPAVNALREVVKLKPDLYQAYNNLGLFLQPLACNEEAEASFRKALRLSPRYPEAHNNLANLFLATRRPHQAILHFRRAISLKKNYAEAHFNLGLALHTENDGSGAVAAFRRAVAIRPDWAEAHQSLGNALCASGHFDEAELALQKALAIKPDFLFAHNSLGNLRLAQNRLQEAIVCYNAALSADGGYAEAYQNRGVAQEELGQPDLAIRDYETTLRIVPDSVDAILGMARVYQTMGEFSRAESLYRSVVANPKAEIEAYIGLVGSIRIAESDLSMLKEMETLLARDLTDDKRATLHGALGKAYDALADYENAFSHFAAAKHARRPQAGFDRAAHAAKINMIIESHPSSAFIPASPRACFSELPVFVVGMPRSGTTLVEQILSSHPQIGGVGEMSFWSDHALDLRGPAENSVDHYVDARLAERYIETISAKAPLALRIVDKLTTNFLRLGTICSALPRARVIHCCRNPLDTCLSVYFTQFRGAHPYASHLDDIAFYYRQYTKLMAHWRSALPKEIFFEVQYENLVSKPENTARTMVEFLGLNWNEKCLAFTQNESIIRTASKWQVRQPLYTQSMNRWRNYERFIGPLLNLVEKSADSGSDQI